MSKRRYSSTFVESSGRAHTGVDYVLSDRDFSPKRLSEKLGREIVEVRRTQKGGAVAIPSSERWKMVLIDTPLSKKAREREQRLFSSKKLYARYLRSRGSAHYNSEPLLQMRKRAFEKRRKAVRAKTSR